MDLALRKYSLEGCIEGIDFNYACWCPACIRGVRSVCLLPITRDVSVESAYKITDATRSIALNHNCVLGIHTRHVVKYFNTLQDGDIVDFEPTFNGSRNIKVSI
jgi:hypothetical protein